MEFYYFSENKKSNSIAKNRINIDEEKLNTLYNEVFNKYSEHEHFDYCATSVPDFINSDSNSKIESIDLGEFIIKNYTAKSTGEKMSVSYGDYGEYEKDKIHITYDKYTVPHLCSLIKKVLKIKGDNFYELLEELKNNTIESKQNEAANLNLQLIKIYQSITAIDNKSKENVDDMLNDIFNEIKKIKLQIFKLQDFDQELENYYKKVIDCMNITFIDELSMDDINKVRFFFELNNDISITQFENEAVKTIGTFKK